MCWWLAARLSAPSDVPEWSHFQSEMYIWLVLYFPNYRCSLLRSGAISLLPLFHCNDWIVFAWHVSSGSSTPGDSISSRVLFLIFHPLACVINFLRFNGFCVITRLRWCFLSSESEFSGGVRIAGLVVNFPLALSPRLFSSWQEFVFPYSSVPHTSMKLFISDIPMDSDLMPAGT